MAPVPEPGGGVLQVTPDELQAVASGLHTS